MKRAAYWAVYALWLFFVTLSAPLIWICWVLTEALENMDAETNSPRRPPEDASRR
jgi:hypothetical protein